MNNNHDKSGPVSNAEEKMQQPRIIQIPVQHIKTPQGGTMPREESPLRTNKLPKHFQDQYTNPSSGFPSSRPSMFDRFDSPFGKRNFLLMKLFLYDYFRLILYII